MDISTTTTAPPAPTDPPTPSLDKRGARGATRPGDRIFLGLSRGSGILLLVIMAAIAVFLTYRASIAISKDDGNFLTTFEWNANATPPVFGIAVLAFGTVVSSVIAMAIAVPVAVGIALFISHYAPRKLAAPLALRRRPARRRADHHLRPVGRPLPRAAPERPLQLARRLLRLDRHLRVRQGGAPARSSPSASCSRS